MPLPTPRTPGARRLVAAFAVTAVAAGGTLLAIGLRRPSTTATWAEAVPVAVARPVGRDADSAASRNAAAGKSYVGGVRLAGYDPAAGTAVLATDTSAAQSSGNVESGDVIASPPSATAPRGALFTVGTVTPTDDGVKVTTKPATLSDAIGTVDVHRTVEAPDIDMSVTPLAAGVTTAAKAPTGPTAVDPAPPSPSRSATPNSIDSSEPATPSAPTSSPSASASRSPRESAPPTSAAPSSSTRSAAPALSIPGIAIDGSTILNPARTDDGGILLTVNIPLSGATGITGTSKGGPVLSGWVGLTPKLIFSYGQKDVDGAKPFQAEIGVGGKYTYGWQAHAALAGQADTGEQAIQIPFATVRLSQTFWVGPVPIVLSVDLTYFYRITAEGDLSIDAEQSTTGEFALGGRYDARTGWGPLNRNTATTTGDSTPAVTGAGDLRAVIGADLGIFLYDSAGVTGRLAPYLRAAVDAGFTPVRWGVYAGFDLTAALTLQLKIFGITLVKADLPIPPVHAEWKIAASTPEPAASTT